MRFLWETGRSGQWCITVRGNSGLPHYDCYYHILYREKKEGTFDDPARREKTFPEIKALVDEARKQPDFDRSHYTRTLNPAADTGRPVYGGSSYPQGGEAVLSITAI